MPEDVPDRMPEDMPIECQTICQIECQKDLPVTKWYKCHGEDHTK